MKLYNLTRQKERGGGGGGMGGGRTKGKKKKKKITTAHYASLERSLSQPNAHHSA